MVPLSEFDTDWFGPALIVDVIIFLTMNYL